MSEHGHHDEGHRVRTIYTLAIIIVLGISLALFWVTQGKGAKAHAAHGNAVHSQAARQHAGRQHAGQGHGAQPQNRAAPTPAMRRKLIRQAMKHPGAKPGPSTAAARVRFAQRMQLRVRRHDRNRVVLATGTARDVLEMRFPAAVKPDQVERLKKATQLFSELKAQGFRQMRIRSGRRILFTKAL